MNVGRALIIVAAAAAALAGAATVKTTRVVWGPLPAEEFVPGEVVVEFAPGISQDQARAAVVAAGAEVERFSIVKPTRAVLRVPVGREDAVVSANKGKPGIAVIQKNYVVHALWAPNDPLYPLQWNYNKPDFIKAEGGWNITRGKPEVVVAVVDTGVAYENYAVPDYERSEVIGDSYACAPDLAGTTFVPGYDFVHNDDHPNDQDGHGTHVAGTIAQTTDNGADVAGLAHKCGIMPVQVLDYAGSGDSAAVADGIDFARDHGADVVNLSLGGPIYDEIIKGACDEAKKAGVVVVAAAGNAGSGTLYYPAGYESVISVSAVDYDGNLAWYSNYGFGLECCAPGGDTAQDRDGDGHPDGILQQTYEQIYDADPPETLANVTTFANWYFQGTSMASPHVAALAALIISTGVTNYDDVRAKLLGSATDKGMSGYDIEYGYGLINCEAALQPGVPDLAPQCGDCGSATPSESLAFAGLFSLSYGMVFAGRRFRRKR